MFTSRFDRRIAPAFVGLLAMTACTIEPAEFRFGQQITGVEFNLFSTNMGIHPNTDVIRDPNNPFAVTGVGAETKWDILAAGGTAAAFYAWATLLAVQPNGEHQYYAALTLDGLSQTGELPEEQVPIVRQMAIAAYQSVLDNFPDSVTFDPTGTTSFRLATPAYRGIVALGAAPQGDWVLVDAEGGPVAVRGSNSLTPSPTAEDDE